MEGIGVPLLVLLYDVPSWLPLSVPTALYPGVQTQSRGDALASALVAFPLHAAWEG